MRKALTLSIAALAVSCLAFGCVLPKQTNLPKIRLVVRERPLWKVHPGIGWETVEFSPDASHVAYLADRGSKTVCVIDGKEGHEYDGITWGHCFESLFSPNSRRTAFIAMQGGFPYTRCFIVVDGVEIAKVPPVNAGSPVFSPDGNRVAFVTMHRGKRVVVVDDVESEGYDLIAECSYTFSPDSKRFGFAAKRDGKWFFVVDDLVSPGYDSAPKSAGPVFSPDSKHVAYVAMNEGKLNMYLDGKPLDLPFQENRVISNFAFSLDGKRLAYSAKRHARSFVVVDGQAGTVFDDTDGLAFSVDGRRFAYKARRGDSEFIVLDGVEGNSYKNVDLPVFSPDSKRVAYFAYRGSGKFVVVDGVEGNVYEETSDNFFESPWFSPDSRHVAYWGKRGRNGFVVVDGVESRVYDHIEGFRGQCRLVFDRPRSFHTLAVKGRQFFRLDVEIVEQ